MPATWLEVVHPRSGGHDLVDGGGGACSWARATWLISWKLAPIMERGMATQITPRRMVRKPTHWPGRVTCRGAGEGYVAMVHARWSIGEALLGGSRVAEGCAPVPHPHTPLWLG